MLDHWSDNLNKLKLVDIKTLQKNLDFQFKSKNIMVTYHPVSLNENPADGINILLNALKNFKEIGIILLTQMQIFLVLRSLKIY